MGADLSLYSPQRCAEHRAFRYVNKHFFALETEPGSRDQEALNFLPSFCFCLLNAGVTALIKEKCIHSNTVDNGTWPHRRGTDICSNKDEDLGATVLSEMSWRAKFCVILLPCSIVKATY